MGRLVRIHNVDRKETKVWADEHIIYINIGTNLPEHKLRSFIEWIDSIVREIQVPFQASVKMNTKGAKFIFEDAESREKYDTIYTKW